MGYLSSIWTPFFNTYFWFGLFYLFIILGLLFARITWKEYWLYFAFFSILFVSTNYLFFHMNDYSVLTRYDKI